MIVDWNLWREHYHELTFEDQAWLCDLIATEHPDQAHFDADAATRLFGLIPGGNLHVVEVGGWTGDLAGAVLSTNPFVASWTNYDICRWAIASSDINDPRYFAYRLHDWPWTHGLGGDVFVATHMIEHITAKQLELLIASIQAPYVYLEAPLPEHDGEQWHDYPGTHILEIGWPSVDALLCKYGFEVLEGQGDCRLYHKKSPAEAGL